MISLALALVISGSTGLFPARAADNIPATIKKTFEQNLFKFGPEIQRHWAERMFRFTGDTIYHQPVIIAAVLTAELLAADVASLDDSGYVAIRCRQLLDDFNPRTRKGKLRRGWFKRNPTSVFYLRMLANVWRLQQYGLVESTYSETLSRAMRITAEYDYRRVLFDTTLIRIYAAQAVNSVHYLHSLEIVDLREDYTRVFQQVFPDAIDDSLGKREYQDKIYGLTHFITAASGYYQHDVDKSDFSWVLNYFEQNIERIFSSTTSDIVAEVGISFLLTGQNDHPIVRKCRKQIEDDFNREAGMIPSPRGKLDLESGEHRNILAYMLLRWPDKLHAGPDLSQSEHFLKLVRPREALKK